MVKVVERSGWGEKCLKCKAKLGCGMMGTRGVYRGWVRGGEALEG